jgi:hypothetical protein
MIEMGTTMDPRVTFRSFADEYEHQFRLDILSVALAARVGKENDIREATTMLLRQILTLAQQAYDAGYRARAKS